MNNKFGRRKWVKLWCEEWLDGTTGYEMNGVQRAFWVDLLAMAGRSRIPGVICAGKSGNEVIGYPLLKFQGLTSEPLDIEQTFELFQRNDKIRVVVAAEYPVKMYKVEIVNWDRYQSEYERQKPYRTARKKRELQQELQKNSANGYTTEGEGDIEAEEAGASRTSAASTILRAFNEGLTREPFGSIEFQTIWSEEWSATTEGVGALTNSMERTIQRCNSLGTKVPSMFYQIKRQLEKIEIGNQFRERRL